MKKYQSSYVLKQIKKKRIFEKKIHMDFPYGFSIQLDTRTKGGLSIIHFKRFVSNKLEPRYAFGSNFEYFCFCFCCFCLLRKPADKCNRCSYCYHKSSFKPQRGVARLCLICCFIVDVVLKLTYLPKCVILSVVHVILLYKI